MARRSSITADKGFIWNSGGQDALKRNLPPVKEMTRGLKKKIRKEIAAPGRLSRKQEREVIKDAAKTHRDVLDVSRASTTIQWNFSVNDLVVFTREYSNFLDTSILKGAISIVIAFKSQSMCTVMINNETRDVPCSHLRKVTSGDDDGSFE